MNRIFIAVLTACTLVLLVACKPELVSTLKDGESITVYLYKTDKAVDRVVDKKIVKREAAGYKALIDWGKKNKADWEPTTKVYPPVLLIEAKGFSVNVRKDVTVFTYKDGSYVRKTDINDLAWFKKQLGIVDPP